MELTRRDLLKEVAAVSAGSVLGCGTRTRSFDAATFFAPGFEGFACALAYARTRAGEGCRTTLNVREERLLAFGPDDARFSVVPSDEVGFPRTWRSVLQEGGEVTDRPRGICREFLLRMEIMGPVASTPHPRPGQPWRPTLRVADARRLMSRMLEESRVDVVFGHGRAQSVGPATAVPFGVFDEGQRWGTACALAHRSGERCADVLRSERLRLRLERDFSLPG